MTQDCRDACPRNLPDEREFDELQAAYTMSDADLWQTLAQCEVAACHTEG
jgi:hypothetical protein